MTAGIPRTMAEVVRRGVAVRISDAHVWLPGQVQSYDGASNTASVAVMVKLPTFDDDGLIDVYEDLGTILDVPVGFQRYGGFYSAGPITKGDEGILLFASTAIGEWRASGEKGEPVDPARMSVGYPWFLPCAWNDTRSLPDAAARAAGMVLGKEGATSQIRIQSGVIQAGAGVVDAVVLNQAMQNLLTAQNTFNLAIATFASNSLSAAGQPTYILFQPPFAAACGTLVTAASALSSAWAALIAALPSQLFKAQ